MESPQNVLSLGFDQVAWSFTFRGKYLLVEDPRALRQVYHPWEVSQDGDFAALSAKVTAPAKWEGPIFLNLYANDTYVSEGWEQARPRWTHTYAAYHNFAGHRFKQVLIDDQVIWEQDVGDAEEFDYFSLDASAWVKPGRAFTLTLRVLDRVGSGARLPGDEFHLGIWSWDGLADPDAEKKFYTRVFWGDVALSSGAAVSWDQNPARGEVALRPVRPAVSGPVKKATGRFTLDCPEGLPEDGYPVTWGIPFGQGRLLDEKRIALAGEQEAIGQEMAGEVVARDGWVSTRFVAVSDKVVLEADGPERATVLCSGHLAEGEKRFGRFTCRIHAYRGRPTLRVFFRVFNDTDAPAQLVEEMLVRVRTPLTEFRAFESPPILASPEWYAEQQAFGWGAALTPERFPELHKLMMEKSRVSLVCTVPNGLRNWPDSYSDSIYNAYRGTWSNMYQEVDYGANIIALLAGRRAWFDYAEAYQGHFMDIDICHHHADPAWVGASYGISPYHTGHAPYSLNAPLAGLFLLHYLTGDPDAREAAVGIADWLHATNTGVGARSGRAVGWPLRSTMIAYENTYDPKHLQAGRQLAESALSALRPRRQFFSESPATWHYRGGVSTMNAILAAGLMRYWRATGDERAGRACAHIACNMAYSWMSPTEPGMVLGADPLQSVYLTGYAMQDVLPLFWGYELTGDEAFLKKGMQMMRENILAERSRGSAFGLSRYWEMQDILHGMRVAQEAGF